MRKAISFILVLMLVLTSGIAAFAAEVTVPKDVVGTKYEAAVKALMEKDILSGYADNTFRPANTIDRAEACTVVVKAMDPKGADLFNSKENVFKDMKDYEWAAKYINYAASKNIVKGTGNQLFKPADSVTYNEIVTMLVNALGYTDKDLTGIWPANYVAKATELGMFKEVVVSENGNAPATRGDVALLSAAVADKILEANKEKPVVPPTTPGQTVDNGKLADYSGRAYGMIQNTAQVVNAKGDKVDQVEFLMGNKTFYLNTDGKASLPTNSLKGDLYCLKMNDGVVKGIATDGAIFSAKRFVEYTTTPAGIAGITGFKTVNSRSKTIVDAGGIEFNIMDDAIFYVVNFDGSKVKNYESGSLRDIEAGDMIRAFDVTDDSADLADIVIIVKKADAGNVINGKIN